MPIIPDSEAQPNKENAKNDALAFEIKDKQITFMNGKVNQEYCIDFDVESLGIPEIAEVYFNGLEAIGLQYIPEEKKIKGIPTQAGDHKIVMEFKRKDWTEGKPLLPRDVTFIINPDPRVLWSKNIPTPEDIEYYKRDDDKSFIKVEAKKTKGVLGMGKKEIARKDMVAASQRGRSHAIEGKPRDDDFALHFDEETECYIMIVADGAGSAKYSRKGSQIACNTAMDVCKGKLLTHKEQILKNKKPENKNEIGKVLQDTMSNAVFEAYKAIEKEAQDKNYLVKDFATTLLLSVCKKFEYGWFVGAWWVGDGGIGIYRKEPEYLKILGEPDGGEFAGQTRFLTMPEIIKNDLYKRMRFDIVEDFTALILMTDGITDPKFETDANLNRIEKWHVFWDDLNGNNEDNAKVDFTDDNEQTAEQLLKWLDFWSKGNHDDRTIAILF
ncbi:MAG: protein phosphatase 2C domain-containing protein [Candidatus Azobacteroides sp.]|nr:protein phosphatase 2C domain-containing protein [Candidatus Azobacteroides sp.]